MWALCVHISEPEIKNALWYNFFMWILNTGWCFLTVPPNFQYQNEVKTCQANEKLFYIEIFLAKELWLATNRFYFVTEYLEEQFKNPSCINEIGMSSQAGKQSVWFIYSWQKREKWDWGCERNTFEGQGNTERKRK